MNKKMREIHGYKRKTKKISEKIGALSKSIKLKRIEPYSEEIKKVLASHNTDDDKRTMMFKLIRRPVEGTTTRKKHTENVSQIAGIISENFDWLNSNITRIMGKEHDTGHTFLGHSGEWWISRINDKYGLPNYVHNATGVRKLVYKEKVYDEIEQAIINKEPDISNKKLAKIKRDLWLIMDGINCHNGERSEYSYAPDFSKNEKRFEEELIGCYAKKGYDRSLVPATAEGSLMRLCDKISYIPFDLVDIFRNGCNIEKGIVDGEEHNFYNEYREKFKAIGMPDDTLDRLLNCKTEEDYDRIAKKMQSYFIKDVVNNTKRNNIRMSPEMSAAMHGIRDINNSLMVNYVVMKEDHKAYVPAIEKLMQRYKRALLKMDIINADNIDNSPIKYFSTYPKEAEQFVSIFADSPVMSDFAKFVVHTNPEDFDFTVKSCKRSMEETIDAELDVAEDVALGRISKDNIHCVGKKTERINTYINSFMKSLDVAYNENLFLESSNKGVDDYKKDIWLKKTREKIKREVLSFNPKYENSTGTMPINEMVAMDIGAQYIASLNDEQFFKLIQDAELVNSEQAKSLQRRYSEFDFRSEHQKHADWDNIAKLQKVGTEKSKEDINKEHKRNFLERLFNRER